MKNDSRTQLDDIIDEQLNDLNLPNWIGRSNQKNTYPGKDWCRVNAKGTGKKLKIIFD